MSSQGPEPTLRDLAELIRGLTKQVETLWLAVDDLREEIFAEFRHMRGEPLDDDRPAASPPLHVTSLPRDAGDPDFHRKINAVAQKPGEPERSQARTRDELLECFRKEPVAGSIQANNWDDDSDLPEGKVLAIDGDLFDWLASSMTTEVALESQCLMLDGDGRRILMWAADGECFARRMTLAEDREFEALDAIQYPPPTLPPSPPHDRRASKAQRALW